VTSLTNSTSQSHSPIPSSPLSAAFVNRGAIEPQPTSCGGPPPSQPVSLGTSHPIQGTLASKINVGCKCLMACRCFLRCRFCRCPCIFLFRLQDTLKCRSSCSTCTAKLRHVFPCTLPECFAFYPCSPVKDCVLLLILFLHSCFSSGFLFILLVLIFILFFLLTLYFQ
jgi:hypothetical protein